MSVIYKCDRCGMTQDNAMDKIYIGIDNGVSGSIGIVGGHNQGTSFVTPVKLQQDYTKKQKNLNRLDILCFKGILNEYAHYHDEDNKDLARVAIIERPFVNPMMFQASISAVRCLEAQLCVLESMEISFMFIDSKEWQKALLPYIPLKKKEGETISSPY